MSEGNGLGTNPKLPVLVFQAPGKTSKGFLRRLRRALVFQQALTAGLESVAPEMIDGIVGFLADYSVVQVEGQARDDRQMVEDLLWDSSEEEFNQMLASITGQEDAPPLAKPNSSEELPEETGKAKFLRRGGRR